MIYLLNIFLGTKCGVRTKKEYAIKTVSMLD